MHPNDSHDNLLLFTLCRLPFKMHFECLFSLYQNKQTHKIAKNMLSMIFIVFDRAFYAQLSSLTRLYKYIYIIYRLA